MNTIKATWKNGHIIPDDQVDWPEGCRLTVEPDTDIVSSDDEGPVTPEEIARTLAAMELVQPFDMTEQERADIETWRKTVKVYTIANMHKDIDGLFP